MAQPGEDRRLSEHNAYFDEAYFERGWERGTAYVNYGRSAENSRTFAEIADAVAFVFEPKRILEIGCATGATVRHLNERGIETFGVDVSAWAVENRLHKNVILAGVENLPFSNCEFDLVFSSHSLEHIPEPLAEEAFAEMDRVSKPSGHQFHMLPMVGTYPYDFDHDAARQMLRKDPTHKLLEPIEWWYDRWRSYKWKPFGIDLHFVNDAGLAELSSGQFALCKRRNCRVVERAREWNRRVHRKMFLDRAAQISSAARPIPLSSSVKSLGTTIAQKERKWRDIDCQFDSPISFAGAVLHIIAEVKADAPVPMRIALLNEDNGNQSGVVETYIQAAAGVWSIQLDIANFVVLSGQPDVSKIKRFLIGGELEKTEFSVAAAASFPDGRILQITSAEPRSSGLWHELKRAARNLTGASRSVEIQ